MVLPSTAAEWLALAEKNESRGDGTPHAGATLVAAHSERIAEPPPDIHQPPLTPQIIVLFIAIVVAALIPMVKMIREDWRADRDRDSDA